MIGSLAAGALVGLGALLIWCGLIPARPFVLVGQQSMTDPTRAPQGCETLWAYTHLPREIKGDAAGELPDLGGGRAHVQVTVPLATLVAAKADHGVEPAVLEGIGALSGGRTPHRL